MTRETKYLIPLGFYVGFGGMLQSLTVKLVPLDLSAIGLGVLAFRYRSFVHALTFPCTDVVAEVLGGEAGAFHGLHGKRVYFWFPIVGCVY